jgi:hypothetical protein
MNPTLDQSVIDEALRRDEVAARSEWLCEFHPTWTRTLASSEPRVELPEEFRLLVVLRGNLLRDAGEPRRQLREVEPRVRRGGTVLSGGDHADGRAANLTPAKGAQRRAWRVGRVGQGEGRRPEGTVGTAQVEPNGLVPAGVPR